MKLSNEDRLGRVIADKHGSEDKTAKCGKLSPPLAHVHLWVKH